jgi:hypothetical protein
VKNPGDLEFNPIPGIKNLELSLKVTENDSVRNHRFSIGVCLFNEDPGKEGVIIPGT